MARAGINPLNVFSLKVEPEIVYQRTLSEKDLVFDYNRTILARRAFSSFVPPVLDSCLALMQ